MNTITVSKTFKVTIKGQEFELTADEAKALHVALDAALDKPAVVAPKRIPYNKGETRPTRPWGPPQQPFPYPPSDSFPRPREIWADQREARRVTAKRQDALLLLPPFSS